MFLCRENELGKLNKLYVKDSAECIIIYGRRRVGKTALINEFVKDKPVIYFPALKTNGKDNLEALSKAIFKYTNPDATEAPTYTSFDAAFKEITRLSKDFRLVFVIDELPYLVKSDDSIPSRLQHLLDYDWKDSKLFLILCGSSMSFMEKEILSKESPLFGRRTAQFNIEPLDYFETSKFNQQLTPEENALVYGITGGVPHYINKLSVTDSIEDALLENFFDTSSYLFEEPDNLLKQELREPAIYNSIIKAVAGGASKLNEIAMATGLETAVCAKYIRVLTELKIVSKDEPVTGASSKKRIYRICDNFFKFWYRFVPSNMIAISTGTIKNIYKIAVEDRLPDYMGGVFEDMCRQYLIKYATDLPINIESIGEWWGGHPETHKEIQVDIVALSVKETAKKRGRTFLIGSCKYKNEMIGVDELELLKAYAEAFTNTNDMCYYYIFSKSGFTKGLIEKQQLGEVSLVTLEEMY